MGKQMKKLSWIAVGILSTLVGLYPIMFFLTDKLFGLLTLKSDELLNNNLWNITFYLHISFGGLALLIGWLQFSKKLRSKNLKLHRTIGKIYIISVLISGICSLYIALHATSGIVSILGFFIMGIIWLATTILGFKAIKIGNIEVHQKFMIYSYSACFAAVTLRIWLPILVIVLGEFNTSYRIVAWLSWVPNLIVAYFIVKRQTQSLNLLKQTRGAL